MHPRAALQRIDLQPGIIRHHQNFRPQRTARRQRLDRRILLEGIPRLLRHRKLRIGAHVRNLPRLPQQFPEFPGLVTVVRSQNNAPDLRHAFFLVSFPIRSFRKRTLPGNKVFRRTSTRSRFLMTTSKDMRFRTFLIFGAPGSGKGTQGAILGRIPRFIHFVCGEVFRALDTRTPLGQKFVEYSSRGELVPDELTVQLWKANVDSRAEMHLIKPDIDFLVLDGIPRNVEQARLMEPFIDVLHVFHLSCPDRQELHRRIRKRALKENRFDDARDETIERRIRTYEEESKPMLDFYPRERVTDIDATQHPAVVFHTILSRIIALDEFTESAREVH